MTRITIPCMVSIAAVFLFCGGGKASADVSDNGDRAPAVSARYCDGPLTGKGVDTGFARGDSNYHAIYHATDGNVYFVVSSHLSDTHAHLFRYDPVSEEVVELADIGVVLGEESGIAIPQGKIHSDIFEHEGRLYFGTHAGFYVRGGTSELKPYPGGHFMSFDLATGRFEDYGIGAPEEGLITVAADGDRRRLYALTWPSGIFIYCDIATRTIRSFGPSVEGHDYTGGVETGTVPRYIGVDPRDGAAYWWDMNERVVRYSIGSDSIETLEDHTFSKPVLHAHQEGQETSLACWRSLRFNRRDGKFYGVTYYSEHLVSYDPVSGEVEVIDRIAAGPNRKSGHVSGHASIAFDLSDDCRYICYAPRSGGVHIVTYDLLLRRYVDHGVIRLEDGRTPSNNDSLEIGRDGSIYLVCTVPVEDMNSKKAQNIMQARYSDSKESTPKTITEVCLVVVPNPLKTAE